MTCCDPNVLPFPLVLASASPRRRKILESMNVAFDVAVPDVEEVHWDDDPVGTVKENAFRKCGWARERFPEAGIIAADTVVVFDGKSIGKPKSIVDATAMLQKFSGHSQTVYTGVALACGPLAPVVRVEKSEVHFRELSDVAIEEYFRRVDPLDKAGGYDIDQCHHLIIRAYEGSWTNIMGLPQGVVEAWLTCK
jgi:septum formation protein